MSAPPSPRHREERGRRTGSRVWTLKGFRGSVWFPWRLGESRFPLLSIARDSSGTDHRAQGRQTPVTVPSSVRVGDRSRPSVVLHLHPGSGPVCRGSFSVPVPGQPSGRRAVPTPGRSRREVSSALGPPPGAPVGRPGVPPTQEGGTGPTGPLWYVAETPKDTSPRVSRGWPDQIIYVKNGKVKFPFTFKEESLRDTDYNWPQLTTPTLTPLDPVRSDLPSPTGPSGTTVRTSRQPGCRGSPTRTWCLWSGPRGQGPADVYPGSFGVSDTVGSGCVRRGCQGRAGTWEGWGRVHD